MTVKKKTETEIELDNLGEAFRGRIVAGDTMLFGAGAGADTLTLDTGDVIEIKGKPGRFKLTGFSRFFETKYFVEPFPSAGGSRSFTILPDDVEFVIQSDGSRLIAAPLPFLKSRNGKMAWKVASTVSSAASVYHGYKRNESIGWALLWGAMGATFPIVTPVIAIAQGFGKKASK